MAHAMAGAEESEHKAPSVGIIGLGYVGLPLLLQFCRAGLRTIGFDIDPTKVEKLRAGESYIRHIPASALQEAATDGQLEVTTDFSRIGEVDAVLICVPTPLTRHREPDISYVLSTGETIGPYLRSGQLVVLESTTYPGTTEEALLPVLERCSGLVAGRDFYLAFSPEREDPGNQSWQTVDIPKVVGGLTPQCSARARTLYERGRFRTVPVSSTQAAEATKLLENIFRSVNIALVNELKVVFNQMGIDIWEVIEAARTKPFGFMPFYPGPGLGGHCIPIDPFYLTWKAREYGVVTRFIELAGEINTSMPQYVLARMLESLSDRGLTLRHAKILILGVAYKRDVDDMRESPALVLWELLLARGAQVSYYDPFIPIIPTTREHADLAGTRAQPLTEAVLKAQDVVLIATDHSGVDYRFVVQHASLVIDTRNACAQVPAAVTQGKLIKT